MPSSIKTNIPLAIEERKTEGPTTREIERVFERNIKINSRFTDRKSSYKQCKDVIDIEVYEEIPVDYLDKKTDNVSNLKTFCENAAVDWLDSERVVYLQVESRPYIKKYNMTQDRAQWSAWQVHLRVEERVEIETVAK